MWRWVKGPMVHLRTLMLFSSVTCICFTFSERQLLYRTMMSPYSSSESCCCSDISTALFNGEIHAIASRIFHRLLFPCNCSNIYGRASSYLILGKSHSTNIGAACFTLSQIFNLFSKDRHRQMNHNACVSNIPLQRKEWQCCKTTKSRRVLQVWCVLYSNYVKEQLEWPSSS